MGRRTVIIVAALVVIAITITAAIVFYDDVTSIVRYGRTCLPDFFKNKIAFVIVKGGTYDNEKISSQISKYFDSVKKDLNIDNTSLKKFDGATIGELDKFVDELYLKDDVGYIILIGDDFPTNYSFDSEDDLLHLTSRKLECINRDCNSLPDCKDVAISFIIPPLVYPPEADSDDLKTDFVVKVLETYTGYHNNFEATIDRYQKSVLYIEDPTAPGFNSRFGYNIPAVSFINNESEQIWEEAKKKYVVLYAGVHGQTGILGIGLGNETLESVGRKYPDASGQYLYDLLKTGRMYTELGEWLNFSEEYGVPALFIESVACESRILKDESRYHCCWPQIFMESGVWGYFAGWGGSGELVVRMEKRFSYEKTIGLAVRRSLSQDIFIFGDILAHMK